MPVPPGAVSGSGAGLQERLHKEEPPFGQGKAGQAASGCGKWLSRPSVWLIVQEAGEHGESGMRFVCGDHVSGTLDGEKGDVGELFDKTTDLLPAVLVVH